MAKTPDKTSGPFVTPKGEGDVGANLPHRVIIDGRSPQCPKHTNIALVKYLGDGPYHPVMRSLGDGVEKVIGMSLAGKRNLSIEMELSPVPALRGDAGKDSSSSVFVIDPWQQHAEFGCWARACPAGCPRAAHFSEGPRFRPGSSGGCRRSDHE